VQQRKIAIFASGGGSNAVSIHNHFKDHPYVEIQLLVVNRQDAGILNKPEFDEVDKLLITRQMFYDSKDVLNVLKEKKIDFIVLAGFLWLIPSYLVEAYDASMVNIHPALLPRYGGKGMFGMNVHKAVFSNGEKESGMSVHYVNECYDEGNIIFQSKCNISDCTSPQEIAHRVLKLEHRYYPVVIEQLLAK
jgi:phosphoribosylglycinamide formyltransferase-1